MKALVPECLDEKGDLRKCVVRAPGGEIVQSCPHFASAKVRVGTYERPLCDPVVRAAGPAAVPALDEAIKR